MLTLAAIFFVIVILPMLIIIIFVRSVIFIPNQMAYIVERMGQYKKTLLSGIGIIVPFIDKIRCKQSLSTICFDISTDIETKDDLIIKMTAVVIYKITDPVKATYGMTDISATMLQLARTLSIAEAKKLEIEEFYWMCSALQQPIQDAFVHAVTKCGIDVRFEIKQLEPHADIVRVLKNQRQANRAARQKALKKE